MRILFICKRNETYGFKSYTRRSSGLFNSTRFIVEGLRRQGIHAEIVEVQDNNCIDREVSAFKPDVVVIEALWVVPEKFDVLKRLHRHVEWFVHMHSGLPFLALEGIATEWLIEYHHRGIGIIANSPETFEAFRIMFGSSKKLHYLPNVYISKPMKTRHLKKDRLDIGCFGAVRPMKNHLTQALAAIEYARRKNKFLRFHINATRIEVNGEPCLKNLRRLFALTPNAELVETPWYEPEDFLHLLHTQIDIGMQVSMTETFNVVSADYVTAAVPIVVSSEVKWASRLNKAPMDNLPAIVDRMDYVAKKRCLVKWNQKLLWDYSIQAQALWAVFCHQAR